MEENATYRAVRIDDAAYWRLTVYISDGEMSAYLKNEEDPTEPVATLFEERWNPSGEDLLRKIENVIYDHPQLLEDFSTDIVISTDKTLWVPSAILAAEGEEYLYNKVYQAEEEDIFVDETDDMACLYTLTPGLQTFLRRTLPGARTWCQQTVAVRRFRDRTADMPRIYIDLRKGEADYIGFDGRKMLFATTHPMRDKSEVIRQLFNLTEVFGIDSKECQVSISGPRDLKTEIVKRLREHLTYVMLTMLPSAVVKSEMPMAVAMLVSRVSKEK